MVWPLLVAMLGFSVLRRAFAALASPSPEHIKMAVKHSIFSLIMLGRSRKPWPSAQTVCSRWLCYRWQIPFCGPSRNGSRRLRCRMYFGYNTNGLAHHRLASAITLLADLGYQGVAITIDHAALDPYSPGHADELAAIKEQLAGHSMKTVIETGARYFVGRKAKSTFQPCSPKSAEDRQRRIDFLKRCIDIASALNSDCVFPLVRNCR